MGQHPGFRPGQIAFAHSVRNGAGLPCPFATIKLYPVRHAGKMRPQPVSRYGADRQGPRLPVHSAPYAAGDNTIHMHHFAPALKKLYCMAFGIGSKRGLFRLPENFRQSGRHPCDCGPAVRRGVRGRGRRGGGGFLFLLAGCVGFHIAGYGLLNGRRAVGLAAYMNFVPLFGPEQGACPKKAVHPRRVFSCPEGQHAAQSHVGAGVVASIRRKIAPVIERDELCTVF